MSSAKTLVSTEEVVDFIDHEAELADAHRLQEWLDLWNRERASYLVPYPGEDEGRLRVAIIRDDYDKLCQRIQRLSSGSAHVQDPPSRLCRVMGRVKTRDGGDGSVVASSNFVCVEWRPEREVLWAGTAIHTVAPRVDGGLELWRKEVRLVNAQAEISPLGFLI